MYLSHDMPITEGSLVTLAYRMRDAQGVLLDESEHPVTFTVGSGEILPAFEQALLGKEAGEQHTFTLQPEEAFGVYRPEWVFQVRRDQLQGDSDEPLRVGEAIQLYLADGSDDTPILAYVRSLTEEMVELDANHPLAGKALTYEVEILRVE